jgi:competence ComEA-like helix-hairpin-helix protein
VFLAGLSFFRHSGASGGDGVLITTWKQTDVSQSLPQKININTADEAALQMLPGIGSVLAERIVEWRQTNGYFTAVQDLLAVEGIGEGKLNEIRDFITVQEEP